MKVNFVLFQDTKALKGRQFEYKMGGAYLVTWEVLCSVRFHTDRLLQLPMASRYFQTFAFCSWFMLLKAPPHCPNWDWRECACANFHSEALKRGEGRLTQPWQYSRVTTHCYLRHFFSLQSNRQTLIGWRMQTPVLSIECLILNGHVETAARRRFDRTAVLTHGQVRVVLLSHRAETTRTVSSLRYGCTHPQGVRTT